MEAGDQQMRRKIESKGLDEGRTGQVSNGSLDDDNDSFFEVQRRGDRTHDDGDENHLGK